MKLFIRGISFLIITAFFGECLEFIINMILARELGEHGMGIYMSILPSIFLIAIIASLELPVSLSKFIAEKEVVYHRNILSQVWRLTIVFTCIFLLAATVLYSVFPFLAEYHPSVRWLTLLLIPIISFSSIARGYFMGVHHMGKIAAANFLRKIAQLILLVIVYQLFSFEVNIAIIIALCTFIASEGVVFLYFMQAYVLSVRSFKRISSKDADKREVGRALLSVSFPTTVLRIFHAVTHAIQPFLIKAALLHSGLTEVAATEHFGVLAGIALTIGFFPAFIAHSLLVALIPIVSEKVSKNDIKGIHSILRQVVWITLGYGTPAVMVFYIWGDDLTNVFFHSTSASYYLKLLWPYFFFHFFVMPLQAFMIGFGLIKDALYHTIWATVVSFSLIYFLGSLPQFGMAGVLIGMNTGAVLLTLLHYNTVCSRIGLTFWFKSTVSYK
jgi:stage V sporulation protein B